jgi:hypothetical protein
VIGYSFQVDGASAEHNSQKGHVQQGAIFRIDHGDQKDAKLLVGSKRNCEFADGKNCDFADEKKVKVSALFQMANAPTTTTDARSFVKFAIPSVLADVVVELDGIRSDKAAFPEKTNRHSLPRIVGSSNDIDKPKMDDMNDTWRGDRQGPAGYFQEGTDQQHINQTLLAHARSPMFFADGACADSM